MNFWQGLRALNSLGRRQASKFCLVNCASVAVPLRNKHGPKSLSQSATLKVIRSASYAGATNSRRFSSDSGDSTLDDERHRLRSDPEIRAWMNQIAQDFETPADQALNDDESATVAQDSLGRPSSDEGVASLQATSDIDVEDFGYVEDDEDDFVDPIPEKEPPVSLQRGQCGVFDVEEVVAVLDDENGVDIQVIDIPPEARFVDHMVVVSGKSLRHMRAMAASIEWLYKRKKKKSDRHFRLEGRECKDWFAMDLGNIAVHIFMPEARAHYDLETLWTLGPEHDDPRHYVQDESLNLSEADLFWLESGRSKDEQASAPQTAEDSRTLGAAGGRAEDVVHSVEQSLSAGSEGVDGDPSEASLEHGRNETLQKSD